MDDQVALRCSGLTKSFNGNTAVDALDLSVPNQNIFGLLGPNGSGKTTTIRMALGIYARDAGEVETLATLPSLDQIRAKVVGLIQAPAQKIAMVLNAPAGQLARVIEARRAAMEESGDET